MAPRVYGGTRRHQLHGQAAMRRQPAAAKSKGRGKKGGPDLPAEIAPTVNAIVQVKGGERLLREIAARLVAAEGQVRREQEIINLLMPEVIETTSVATTQLLWNAQARRDALAEFGSLTASQVDELRGSQTQNPHATTGRWLKERRVFAVELAGGRQFPGFQFTPDGEPRPVIARILAALEDTLSGGWERLLWFTGSSGYLEGRRPVDLLDDEPDEIVAAAVHQASLAED